MEIRSWITLDVHNRDSEHEIARKQQKYLERLGYEFQQTDESGAPGQDLCDQYIKSRKSKQLFLKDK